MNYLVQSFITFGQSKPTHNHADAFSLNKNISFFIVDLEKYQFKVVNHLNYRTSIEAEIYFSEYT